jgi:hypothetical protein
VQTSSAVCPFEIDLPAAGGKFASGRLWLILNTSHLKVNQLAYVNQLQVNDSLCVEVKL